MKRVLKWQIATVQSIPQETHRVKTFTLALPEGLPHRAGQHYDIRLLCYRFCQAPCVWASTYGRPLRPGFSDTMSAAIGENSSPTSGLSSTVHSLAALQALGISCPVQPSIRAGPVWPDT
jgi:hypothetical protein